MIHPRDLAEAAPDFLAAKFSGRLSAGAHPVAQRLFHDLTVAELATGMAGVEAPPSSGIVAGVFAALTRSDFPEIFTNSALEVLTAAFALQTRHRVFASMLSLRDLKPAVIATMPPPGEVREVTPASEIPAAEFEDAAATSVQLHTYAAIAAITRPAWISDDFRAFARSLTNYASSFSALEAGLVYSQMESNPDFSDGDAWFNAGAGNLLTGASLDATNLAAAMAALRKQPKDSTGTLADAPAFALIVSADDELSARQLARGATVEGSPPLNVVASARIAGGAGAHWYVCANPRTFPTVGVFTLKGHDTPIAPESREDFDTDSYQTKLRYDVAAAPLSRVGIVRCEA